MYSMPAKAPRAREFHKTGGRDANILYSGIATFYQRLEVGEKFLKGTVNKQFFYAPAQ